MAKAVKVSEVDDVTFQHICCNVNLEPAGSGLLEQATSFDWGPSPNFVPNMSQSYNNKLRRQHWEAASPASKVLFVLFSPLIAFSLPLSLSRSPSLAHPLYLSLSLSLSLSVSFCLPLCVALLLALFLSPSPFFNVCMRVFCPWFLTSIERSHLQ